MNRTQYRAQVHTQDGKLLSVFHGSTTPEAFEKAWAFMRARLASPLPPDMEVVVLNDLRVDTPEPHEALRHRHAYTVCRTVRVVKWTKQDCQDCGFPDVSVEEGRIEAADTMGFLQMGNLLHLLVADGPSVISSPVFRRQMECECCTMLAAKGVRPPKDVRV